MLDARQRRTRAKLRDVILTLASEGPLDRVTMSSLAIAAELNRSTIYEHTTSPEALLESVLVEELDDLRSRYLVPADADSAAEAARLTTVEVLEHVERHAAVYRWGLGDDARPGPLVPVLAGHFRDSVRLLVAAGALVIPTGGPQPDLVARFVGDGTAALLSAWLATPEPRDPQEFTARYQQLLPSWWTGLTA